MPAKLPNKKHKQKKFDLYAEIKKNIARYGRQVMCIFGDEGDLGFVYTIGNQESFLPELVMLGPVDDAAGHVLNIVSDKMKAEARPFNHGEKVLLHEGCFPVLILHCSNPKVRAEYTIQAGQYYGNEGYAVHQVVLCDKHGKYPGEPGCEEPFASVPLLHQSTLITGSSGAQSSKLIH